jgi:hypothetical protein
MSEYTPEKLSPLAMNTKKKVVIQHSTEPTFDFFKSTCKPMS